MSRFIGAPTRFLKRICPVVAWFEVPLKAKNSEVYPSPFRKKGKY
jgi:hypothetical protein